MRLSLQIFLILSIILYLSIIIHLLRKKNINLQYSLIWIFSGVAMLLISAFPDTIVVIAKIIGIIDPVNVVFVLEGMFVLLILISLTTIVSHLSDRNRQLVQSLSMLEERVRKLERKKNEEIK